MFGKTKKNIVDVEPPKSILERLEYKIEKAKKDDYYTVSVRYKNSDKKSNWKLASSFLREELELELPTFGKLTIDNIEYDVCAIGDDVDICQKRLNDFCKIVDLYDNDIIPQPKEYMEVGDLKQNYIMNNL